MASSRAWIRIILLGSACVALEPALSEQDAGYAQPVTERAGQQAKTTTLGAQECATSEVCNMRPSELSSYQLEGDCYLRDPACLHDLNSTAGRDEVSWAEVVSIAERLGKGNLHHGALVGAAWEDRFASLYCDTWQTMNFSGSQAATKRLRSRLRELSASNGLEVLLVHADNQTDGIGARVKKAIELIAMALRVGFHSVAMGFPPAGSLLQPLPEEGWPHGATWCHDGPADTPLEAQGSVAYEPICWRMDLQLDFFAQTPAPEGRVPLWGSEPPRAASTSQGTNAARFNCLRFRQVEGTLEENYGDGLEANSEDSIKAKSRDVSVFMVALKAAGCAICSLIGNMLSRSETVSRWCKLCESESAVEPALAADSAWHFHKREGVKKKVMRRLFSSIRALASPKLALPGRREARCGYRGHAEVVHVAMHVRRGDVGDTSNFAVTQQLGSSSFSEWLCVLAAALGGRQLLLHVHTEARGRSRRDLLRGGLKGFHMEPHVDDDYAIWHTAATFEHPPTCKEGAVFPEVHIAVNDSPREALLCMAQADVLVTSFSSLGWMAAVLNGGLVLHPDDVHSTNQNVHWDLRHSYMNWADNWFRVSDVEQRPDAVRKAFEQGKGA